MADRWRIVSEEVLLATIMELKNLIRNRNTILIDLILNYPAQFNDREYVKKIIMEEGMGFVNEAIELWELLEIVAPYLPVEINEDVLLHLYNKGRELTIQEREKLGKEIKYRHFENIVRLLDKLDDGKDWQQFLELLKNNRNKRELESKKH